MVRRSILAAAAALTLATIGPVGAAAANTAVATANVNMRAGPSTSYPVVRIVPAGANVASYGCVADYSWCDVGYGGARGWVAASYLTTVVRGTTVVVSPTVGFPVVTYAPTSYWNRYYAGYPWYARGPAYYAPPPRAYRAPAPRYGYGCRNGCSATTTVTGPRGNTASRTRSFHR